jgi:hypothetical protein
MAVKDKRKAFGPGPFDRWNTWAFFGTLVGWLSLLLGQRVLDAYEDWASGLSWLGVIVLLACLVQRVLAATSASDDRRRSARTFAALNGLGLLALGVYYATTESGRGTFGIDAPRLGTPDMFGDVAIVLWITLLSASLLPSVLGELARRSMFRAERVESRRIVAAVVGGMALTFAAVYGSLFTFSAGTVEWQMDFSFFRVAKPSESTLRMVNNLEEPLLVRAYFPGHSEVKTKVIRYLKELQQRTDKLEIEETDRLLAPDSAKEDKVRKDGVLVLVRGKSRETIDIGTENAKAATKLKRLDGEFQKGLLKAMRDKRTLYLTVGHGELNEAIAKKSMRTTRVLKELMERQNYDVKNLGLPEGLGSDVPDDAYVVLVLGPTEPFAEREVESLKEYAARGGALMLAIDPDAKIDLSPLAAIAGVTWNQDLVINDQVLYRMKRNESDKKILVAKRFSSHASVSTLSKLAARGAAVLLPGACALEKLDGVDKALKIDFAVKSVPGSYIDLNGSWSFDKDGEQAEKKGTFNLAAATSRKIEGGDDDSAPEMRVFLVSDADGFTDPVMEYAKTNQLLFVEALRWLGGEESFSGEATSEEDVRIVHTKGEDSVWFYATIIGAPSMVLGLGLFLLYGRRKKDPPPRNKRKASDESKTRRAENLAKADEDDDEGELETEDDDALETVTDDDDELDDALETETDEDADDADDDDADDDEDDEDDEDES